MKRKLRFNWINHEEYVAGLCILTIACVLVGTKSMLDEKKKYEESEEK